MSQGPDPIAQVERSVQKLRIEYEKFFNGAESIPPEGLRQQVETEIRNLRRGQLTSADAFRVSSLEAKFNSYSEMFARRLRRLEEGRPLHPRRTPAPESRASRPDPTRGVRLGQGLDPQSVEALYQGLYRGGGRVDLDSFRNYLAKNLATIQEKTGCREAEFRLVEEEGKAKLKVRPIASSRDASKE